MNATWINLTAAWRRADIKTRVVFSTAVGAVLALALGIGVWAMNTNYQVLFAELDGRDAAAIVDELRRMKIPYKVADGGDKILVEEKRVHETRISLMGRGVPISGGVGFEIFDNKDVGMTEYTQKINYQRALQGELTRTIMAIQQVRQARVHLVVADGSIFKRQKVKPKASVSLGLKPGASLTSEQILGIQRLVAAAVPGLEPPAVTVLDHRGVTLSATVDADEGLAAVGGQLKLKKNAEDYFARKIAEVLDRTFGPGQAIVSVDVTLNFDEIRRTQESIVPVRAGNSEDVGAVVRKRQSVYRQARSPITKATVNGDPSYAATSPELNSTTEVEYEIGKSVEQVVTAPGGIRRVNVGIVVPRLGDNQIARIHSIVSMVVGLNEARGDAIAIQPIDQLMLDSPAVVEAAAPAVDASPAVGSLNLAHVVDIRIVLSVLALALLTLLAVRFLGRARRQPAVQASTLSEAERRARLVEVQALLAREKSRRQD